MLEQESLSTDVLVIGSGIAGMVAAIEARKAGAEVVLASRAKLGKESSTAVARTFAFGSEVETRGRNMPAYDNKPGKYIEDPALARTLSEEAPRQIENLLKLGVPMVRIAADRGYEKLPAYRPQGSDAAHGGAIVLDLLGPVAAGMGIRAVEGCQVINLLRDRGRVSGASGLCDDGRWLAIYARSVVLAAGGAAGLPEVTCSSREVCGAGYAMALRAGISLKNMEFNEYYPVGLPTPRGQYVHCAPLTLMMKGASLRNEAGEDVVKKHFGISVQEAMPTTTMRFEWLPRAVALEMEKGKVYVDLTGVPDEDWDRLPERNWKQIRQTRVDMKRTPLPIMPMSIAFKGGIPVDVRMRSSLDGLYAAGEVVAAWMAPERWLGYLTACLAMGGIAGRSAAADLVGVKAPRQDRVVDEGFEGAQSLVSGKGGTDAREIGDGIRRVAYRRAGPVRSAASLEEGLRELDGLQARAVGFRCGGVEELRDAHDTEAMLLTARAVLKASLVRTESRGGFYRRDFPERNDQDWLRPIVVSRDQASGEVRSAPGEKLVVPRGL